MSEKSPFPFGLTGSATPSFNSGGTASVLPAERARASFEVEKMTNFLDGGADRTKKRRWIISQTLNDEYLGKVETSRADQIKVHLKSFIDVHKEFAEKGYIPERWEVAFMSINSVHKGALMNHCWFCSCGVQYYNIIHGVHLGLMNHQMAFFFPPCWLRRRRSNS